MSTETSPPLSRITVDLAREAYAATGLVPTPKTTFRDGCACPIWAVGEMFGCQRVDAGGPDYDPEPDARLTGRALGLSDAYSSGFMHGFDDEIAPGPHATDDRLAGYADGRDCRREFVESEGGAA